MIGGGWDGSEEHASRGGRGRGRFFLSWCIFPCATLAFCFGPPHSLLRARSVFFALVVAWLSRILSWEEVWGTPSNSDAGGGAVRIHKHCGFNPMNPAAVRPNSGCHPCCLVSGRVCLVGACLLARAGVPLGILLCRAILTGEAGASC